MKVLVEKTLDIDMPAEEFCKAIMGSDNYELISTSDVIQCEGGFFEDSSGKAEHIVRIKLKEKID